MVVVRSFGGVGFDVKQLPCVLKGSAYAASNFAQNQMLTARPVSRSPQNLTQDQSIDVRSRCAVEMYFVVLAGKDHCARASIALRLSMQCVPGGYQRMVKDVVARWPFSFTMIN